MIRKGPCCRKGGNKDRDKRTALVRILTSRSHPVSGSSITEACNLVLSLLCSATDLRYANEAGIVATSCGDTGDTICQIRQESHPTVGVVLLGVKRS